MKPALGYRDFFEVNVRETQTDRLTTDHSTVFHFMSAGDSDLLRTVAHGHKVSSTTTALCHAPLMSVVYLKFCAMQTL